MQNLLSHRLSPVFGALTVVGLVGVLSLTTYLATRPQSQSYQSQAALNRPGGTGGRFKIPGIGDGGGQACLPDGGGGQGCNCTGNNQCNSGYCTPDKYCSQPLGQGMSCRGDADCASGYCNDQNYCDEPKSNMSECSGDSDCASGFCSIPQGQTTGVCKEPADQGLPCTPAGTLLNQCDVGLYCDQSGYCFPQRSGGEPCTVGHGEECLTLKCIDGTCASENRAMGETCTSGIQCATSQCQNGRCVHGAPNGEACNSNEECYSGLCDNHICRDPGSGGQPTPTPTEPVVEPTVTSIPGLLAPTATPVVKIPTLTPTPTSAPQALRCDLNGDGKVNGADLSVFMSAWGSRQGQPNYNPKADLNNDGKIDSLDVSIFITQCQAVFQKER